MFFYRGDKPEDDYLSLQKIEIKIAKNRNKKRGRTVPAMPLVSFALYSIRINAYFPTGNKPGVALLEFGNEIFLKFAVITE